LRAQRTLRNNHRRRVERFWAGAMSKSGAGFDYDRYRRLQAEATDERRRLAFIDLLVDEKAKERLAEHAVRDQVAGLGLAPRPNI
jgi:hypothetical protein